MRGAWSRSTMSSTSHWVRARFGVSLKSGVGFRAIAGLVASRVEYRRMDGLDVRELGDVSMLCCVSGSCTG